MQLFKISFVLWKFRKVKKNFLDFFFTNFFLIFSDIFLLQMPYSVRLSYLPWWQASATSSTDLIFSIRLKWRSLILIWRTWFMLAGIGILLLLAIIFYINNRQKHKAKLKSCKRYSKLKWFEKKFDQFLRLQQVVILVHIVHQKIIEH